MLWSIRNIYKGDDHCIHWTAISKIWNKAYECRTNRLYNGVQVLVDDEWVRVPGRDVSLYKTSKSTIYRQIRRFFDEYGIINPKPKNIIVNGYRLLEEPWATDNNDGVEAVCEKDGKRYRMTWAYDKNWKYDINKPTSIVVE